MIFQDIPTGESVFVDANDYGRPMTFTNASPRRGPSWRVDRPEVLSLLLANRMRGGGVALAVLCRRWPKYSIVSFRARCPWRFRRFKIQVDRPARQLGFSLYL